jgi:hypothetical protein
MPTLVGRGGRIHPLEFTTKVATAKGAPDTDDLGFRHELVGRGGRNTIVEFSTRLATAKRTCHRSLPHTAATASMSVSATIKITASAVIFIPRVLGVKSYVDLSTK